jgi:hypothetical protein
MSKNSKIRVALKALILVDFIGGLPQGYLCQGLRAWAISSKERDKFER